MAGVTTLTLHGDLAMEYRAQVLYDLDVAGGSLLEAAGKELLTDLIAKPAEEIHDLVGELRVLGDDPKVPVEVVVDSDVLRGRLGRVIENATDGLRFGSESGAHEHRPRLRRVAWATELLDQLDRDTEAVVA